MELEDDVFADIYSDRRGVNPETLKQVLLLAIEIAREGREGRKVGTLFVVADEAATLRRSKPLILDPLWYHPQEDKQIGNPNLRETIKELSQLDGAFIVADDGTVLSACRYINSSSEGIDLPLGLGSRHMAGASITKQTDCVAVVVSESSVVRVFDDGEIISEILPGPWLLRRDSLHLKGPYSLRSDGQLTVASKSD
jgi:diadenylate cyclase